MQQETVGKTVTHHPEIPLAAESGEVHAQDCVLRSSLQYGAGAFTWGKVSLVDCECSKSRHSATMCTGEGTKLDVKGGRFYRSQRHVVVAGDGAQVSLSGLTMAKSTDCEVFATESGTHISVDKCTLEQNGGDGGTACCEAVLDVKRTRSVNNKTGLCIRDDVNQRI